jgi:hypothetical protein
MTADHIALSSFTSRCRATVGCLAGVVLASVGFWACGDSQDRVTVPVSCVAGKQGCSCLSNASCNAGLSCALDKCVAPVAWQIRRDSHLAGSYDEGSIGIRFDSVRTPQRDELIVLTREGTPLIRRLRFPNGDGVVVTETTLLGTRVTEPGQLDAFLAAPEVALLPRFAALLAEGGLNGGDYPAAFAVHEIGLAIAEATPVPSWMTTSNQSSKPGEVEQGVAAVPQCSHYLFGAGLGNTHTRVWPMTCPDQQCSPETTPQVEDNCSGMCGPNCTCWPQMCGDCCVNPGCVVHDEACKSVDVSALGREFLWSLMVDMAKSCAAVQTYGCLTGAAYCWAGAPCARHPQGWVLIGPSNCDPQNCAQALVCDGVCLAQQGVPTACDRMDPDCREVNCDDGQDNDGDGQVDCADDDCVSSFFGDCCGGQRCSPGQLCDPETEQCGDCATLDKTLMTMRDTGQCPQAVPDSPLLGAVTFAFVGDQIVNISGGGGFQAHYDLKVGADPQVSLAGYNVYTVRSVLLKTTLAYETTSSCSDTGGVVYDCASKGFAPLSETVNMTLQSGDFDLTSGTLQYVANGSDSNPIPDDFFQIQLDLARDVATTTSAGALVLYSAGSTLRLGTADQSGYPELGYFYAELTLPQPYLALGISPGGLITGQASLTATSNGVP